MAGVLQLDPETDLQFILSYSEETARCTMAIGHSGSTNEYLAFKVKTTQPRRYLVRPNQDLVAPGSSEKVAILLVDKYKQALLKSYESLGQSALDHAKDKFLVQSCTVNEEFSSSFQHSKNTSDKAELYDALNRMWSSIAGGAAGGAAATSPVQNKKLHVRLFVKEGSGGAGGAGGPPAHGVDGRGGPGMHPGGGAALGGAVPSTSMYNQKEMLKPPDNSMALDSMSPEQLYAEVSSLRRKYDELVSFSVNLKAERDILNNTLEQTKRELNREVATRASLENKGYASGAGGPHGSGVDSADPSGSGADPSSAKKTTGSNSIMMKLMKQIKVLNHYNKNTYLPK